MTNITDFANELRILRPSKYTVTIVGGVGWADGDCKVESVTFPGRGIASIERRTFGPLREMPYERLYTGDLEIVFAGDVDHYRRDLEKWMDKIISPEDVINATYSDYTAEILISIAGPPVEREDYSHMACRVLEAWPKSITPISLGYGMVDDYVKMSVAFSFREIVYTGGLVV